LDHPDAGEDPTSGVMSEAGAESDAGGSATPPLDATSSSTGAAHDASPVTDAGPAVDGPKDSPVDVFDAYVEPPNLIENGHFDMNYAGWTFVPSNVEGVQGNGAFIEVPQGTGVTPCGEAQEMSMYEPFSAYTVDMSQTVTNLQDGQYQLYAFFNRGVINTAYLYAKNCGAGTPDGGLRADIPLTSSTGWVQVWIHDFTVTGGSCQVGVYVDALATQWLGADCFAFEYLGPSARDAAPE
jgi:hypothetical protein